MTHQVHFYWAPLCSGPESVGEVLKTVLDTAEDDGKRAVIITAFAVHDAFELLHASNGFLNPEYESALPSEVVAKDGLREAALGACRDTTVQLIETAAATSASSSMTEQSQQSADGHGRRAQGGRALRYTPGHRRTDDVKPEASNSGGGVGLSFSTGVSSEAPAPSPPLIFLLQNNRYPADMVEDAFLEEVQQIQRQEVDAWEKTEAAQERGIFLVNSSVSLFGNLSCFRNGNPIHFYEPVKLVEGKMLWDLLSLVDREESSPAGNLTSRNYSSCLESGVPRLSSTIFGVLFLGMFTSWCTLAMSVWL